ncbi:PEP-CTERM sorting domain-containing protein [Aeoliella mucimassa]|uniref:Ice-binding protein C-terminal domain-containing protein n=1 Tax=Aeoliella mucimassa TaxID=2527972 RepID=A0A518AUW1_9BACT|nr:PEP-CTERM sorting domain-containing protein [Aeoliella mucimassa]QDU58513.1 hypothetical protein Pan181_47510 [Aeoliella mucimassa]
MKIRNLAAGVARQLGRAVTSTVATTGAAILAGGILFSGQADGQILVNQNFEDLTLTAGDPSYTNVIPGWTRDNSGMSAPSTNLAYDGGTAMNRFEWESQQGNQLGRNDTGFLQGNNALIFDGDAWDDFADGDQLGFNSYWSTTVDVSSVPAGALAVDFSYEFASYESQQGLVQVSFDGGTNYQTILDLDSEVTGDNILSGAKVTYVEGSDFTNRTSNNMTLRIGMIDADNDWWFAVDNVLVGEVNEVAGYYTLSLQVSDSGEMAIVNTSQDTVYFDYYEITSEAGSLDLANWTSLQESGLAGTGGNGTGNGWEEGGNLSDSALSELFLQGATSLAPGESLSLGAAYDGPTEDLEFTFGRYGQIELVTPDGDYNDDGVVDMQDYDAWKSAFGTSDAATDGNGDGTVNLADYTIWRDNLGAEGGMSPVGYSTLSDGFVHYLPSGVSAVSATNVPEPGTSVLLIGLATLAGGTVVRRRF